MHLCLTLAVSKSRNFQMKRVGYDHRHSKRTASQEKHSLFGARWIRCHLFDDFSQPALCFSASEYLSSQLLLLQPHSSHPLHSIFSIMNVLYFISAASSFWHTHGNGIMDLSWFIRYGSIFHVHRLQNTSKCARVSLLVSLSEERLAWNCTILW